MSPISQMRELGPEGCRVINTSKHSLITLPSPPRADVQIWGRKLMFSAGFGKRMARTSLFSLSLCSFTRELVP